MTNRRSFLIGSAALAALGATGVRPAFAQADRLRLLWWGSQDRADRTFAVADLFEAANSGMTVDGEFLGWGDYWPRVATQTAGGNAPDVIQMDYRYLFEYARRGALAPLEGYRGEALHVDDFDQAQIEGGSVDGSLYGISLGANSSALMLNVAAFEEVGMDLPGPDTTWEEFAAAMTEFSQATPRQNYAGTADGSGVEPLFENWLRQRGKALYTADEQLGFDAADVTEWFQMWADMRAAGATVPPDVQALDQYTIETGMVSLGRAATSFAHSNQLVGYQAINPEPITLSNYPRVGADGSGGHYRKPSMFFSVASQAANPEGAVAFIDFFVNNPEAAAVLGVERGVPESAAVRDALTPTLDELGQRAVAYVAGLGDLAGALPPPPPAGAGEVDFALRRVSEEIAFGATTPEAAGPAFIDEAAGILARG
ncbi:carbohydrate ABC transporter substrate-binding protein [Arsenicitalea aurantiaca]|uniref:Carbohydrate ABC transporter substrate-binding protein n=2 Tax=Arsenicitalea aurantiaca TaxID=1783274 RepID=A0A433X7L2_9HYPH|nr:ABC transporter substrate-binding protein [Arsenicitalea aurantiaca]RUT30049.1 carbohydrate ABC transporter substrate-binding protein [Arsenicitalea aurantiaca]